jgi:hypothetical protein
MPLFSVEYFFDRSGQDGHNYEIRTVLEAAADEDAASVVQENLKTPTFRVREDKSHDLVVIHSANVRFCRVRPVRAAV